MKIAFLLQDTRSLYGAEQATVQLLAGLTAAERSPANQHTPIFQAHGQRDGMVVLSRGMQSRDALKALGYDVEWHEYPMEHSVCMEEIADLNRFLVRVLG